MLLEQAAEVKPRSDRPRIPRWVWVASIIAIASAALGLIIVIWNWPFTQKALTQTLENRSSRTVEIQHFRQTWFPPGCIAE